MELHIFFATIRLRLSVKIEMGGWYSATSDLALGKKVGNLDFWDGGGYSETKKSQSAKICLKFNFPGGGILKLKSQSAKISDNFHGGGYSETQKSKCQDL